MDERDPGLFPLQGLLLNGDQERTTDKTGTIIDIAASDSDTSAKTSPNSRRRKNRRKILSSFAEI